MSRHSFKSSVFSFQFAAIGAGARAWAVACVWLLASILSPLAPSALAPSASAATITGPIIKADSTPYVGTVLFRPLSTPLPIAPNIVTGGDFKVSTASDGTFTVDLQAGDYRVIIGADKGFLIDVPNDSATYTLLSRITTALSWNSSITPSTNLYATATSSTEGILKTYSTVGSPVVFTTNDLPTMGSYLTRHLTTAAYTTIATLQAATVPTLNKQRIFVGGVNSDGDGGGGWFTYDSTNSITSDGYMVVAPNSGPGRYLREYSGPVNVLWFGAMGDGVADDAPAVQRALNFADAPTYGYGLNAYSSSTTLSVYCPPGRYLTRSTITLKGADIYGKFGGKGDWNAHTVFVCGHSGHLFTYDFNSNFRVPHIHDLYMFGYPETYQAGKVAISAVTSRTVFTVATNSLPTLSGSGIPNFAFFFDNEGGYLGHGVISSINSSTGDVTLSTGYDDYATVSTAGGLLRTSDKVVFTPLIATEGFYSNIADPASAGSCAIFIKNTHPTSTGRPPRMSRLYIEKFWTGIRIGGNILDSWTDDVSILNCKFAGICAPRWYATTDNIYSRLYISGSYRADYDTTRTNSFTAGELRNAPFGYYGLGPSDHLSTCIIESASLANVCLVGTLQQSIHDVHLDDTKRYGLMAIDGYNSGTGPFSTWAQISQCFIRSPLAGVSQDSIHTNDRVAVKITGTTVGRPVRLGFSQISIVDGGGGDFDNGFDIATAPGHTVRVSQLQDTSGAVNVVGASSGKPQFLDWRAIGSASLADVGPYWPAANSWSVAASGGQVLNVQSTGVKIWANSGADPLELVRNDTGHSWGVQLSTDTLRLRNTFRGVTGLDLFADTSSVSATLGLGGYSSAPRVSQLQAELASSAAGTDVAASTFNIIGSRGTGASTSGGDIAFYTAVAGSSGTTPQSVAQRLVIKRDGAVRFVNKSSAPTVGVTDGDVYYDSSVPGLRVRQSGAWVTLGAAGSGGVVDGDKGDITATGSGTTWTIDPGVVSYAKMQNVSAASKVLGRGSASGAGAVEELALGTGLQMTGTNIQVTIGAEVQGWDSDLAALAALATSADKVPYFTGSSMAALADFTSFGRTLAGSANASSARSALGVAVGSDVQAYDAELAALAGLTSAADKMPYFTGSGTAATADLTAFSRTVLASPDAATARATLGVSTNGTVASVSVIATNGVSGTVQNASTTPAISLTLGAITPTSVNGITISGSSTPTLAVTGTTSVSGTNTGDQTSVTGNAGTATALQTARTINGVSFNGTANITVPADAGTLTGTTLASGVTASSLTSFGSSPTLSNPTLSTPTLGTPTQANLANATNLPISTGVSGLGSGVATALATPSSANIFAAVTDETGSGSLVGSASPTFSGQVTIATGSAASPSLILTGTSSGLWNRGSGVPGIGVNGSDVYSFGASTFTILGGSGTSLSLQGDANLVRGAANRIDLRNSTSAQAFRIYNTYTDASNGEWGVFDWQSSANNLLIGTFKNGTGSNRAIVFTIGGSAAWQFTSAGHFTAWTDNAFDIGASGASRPRNVYIANNAVVGNDLQLGKTVTAAGTTGAQTINKSSGSVNFAAAATSLVVTDSLVTTASIITATVASNDTTMKSVAVVAASGSFTIYPNAAPTAETRVNFLITN